MTTAEEREMHFREELDQLLNRHGAEIELDINGRHVMGRPVATITMNAIYDDSGSGDMLADFCEFEL